MSRRWRAIGLQVFAACLAAAFLTGPVSMASMAGMAPHDSHQTTHDRHSGPSHQSHHQTECCDSCAVHCSAQLSLHDVHRTQPDTIASAHPVAFPTPAWHLPQHPRYRFPPSQAPPALPG